MNGAPRNFFEFETFRVDVGERLLLQNGKTVSLTAKTFDILLALVENAGRTVDKNELMQTVWEDTFVEEGNLNRHISTLRKLLGDDAHQQKFIKTIPKRGYRFTNDVKEITAQDDLFAIETVSHSHLLIREETRESFWTMSRFAAAVGILIGVGLLGAWAFSAAGFGKRQIRLGQSTDTEAMEAFSKGRTMWRDRSAASLHDATLLLEKAVQKDPDFALGHAALADAYAFDYANWKKAEAEAISSIALDPDLGEPHASLGFVKMFWQWDLPGAEAEFKRAVELSPNYASGHQWFAASLAANTQMDAALVEIGRALELEPDSVAMHSDKCQILYFAAKYQDALAECQKTLQLDPSSVSTHEHVYNILSAMGLNDEAVDKYFENRKFFHGDLPTSVSAQLRQAYTNGGIKGFRTAQIGFFTNTNPNSYRLAQTYARLGNTDKAFEALQKSYESKEFDLIFVAADPVFAQMLTDSRMKVLLDKFRRTTT